VVEDRLMRDTWLANDYDLIPRLTRLTHFSFLECPEAVRQRIDSLFTSR
jgi:hypothetical protein